jgi:putative oxygen-independent coproporphyrinogen III oxidase
LAGALPEGDLAPQSGMLSQAELSGSAGRSFHAYVHIPFCTVRCGYCDFNTYTATELGDLKQSDYARALISEVAFSAEVLEQSGFQSRALKTVFFGGGTPTLLPAADLIAMLESLRNQFGIEPGAEITSEANPDTLDLEKLSHLREAGFNRLSIGMQSAVPSVLKTLERTHNPKNVAISTALAKQLEFQTSVDLIFGAPGETLQQWRESVETAIALEPDHISAYALIVEPGTKLARQISGGKLAQIDEDLQAEKYELADSLLANAGYGWYEISNWSKSIDTRSSHNLAYWLGQDWWGYGPGAHSHIGSVRWWNQKHPLGYSGALSEFRSPAVGREMLDPATAKLERLLLESRLAEGMKIAELEKLGSGSPKLISELIADGLIDGTRAIKGELVLTLSGRLLADAVVRKLSD